jgi:cytochrome c oxidase subunit 1
MYNEAWGLVAACTIIFGFNATFIPQFLLGNAGMPRRYWSYPAEFQVLNVASTAGASLLAIGFLIVFIYLAIALKYGERAGRNPWGSLGYEWQSPTPPPKNNFDKAPNFEHAPHDYDGEQEPHVG